MGAWDAGPFDNDDALDFLAVLEGSSSPRAAVAEALEAAGDTAGYLEAPDGSTAVAAAAIVAVIRAGRLAGVSDEVAARVHALRLTHSEAAELTQAARAAVERVDSPQSELLELWAEAGSAEAWRHTLAPIRDALSSR